MKILRNNLYILKLCFKGGIPLFFCDKKIYILLFLNILVYPSVLGLSYFFLHGWGYSVTRHHLGLQLSLKRVRTLRHNDDDQLEC